MVADSCISDDYVASLLSQDAKQSTIKYSALGIQAFLPRRPTTNAPKPNVRFLKNIIRDTDNHNAALKAREEADAKKRLGRAQLPSPPDSRVLARHGDGRFENRDAEEGGGRKRRRLDGQSRHEEHKLDRPDRSRRSGTDSRGTADGNIQRLAGTLLKSLNRLPRQSEHERRSRQDRIDSRDESSHRRRRHHSPQRSTSRSRHRHRRRRRSSPNTRDDSMSAESASDREPRKRRRRRHRSSSSSPARKTPLTIPPATSNPTAQTSALSPAARADSDSDPLEAIVGPLPPPAAPQVQRRGRGTAALNAMDARFSSTYDPAMDVRPNSDSENDWDQALEALHDRTRWKQQGAERLRAAGFTDEEVGKWERGGERREEDVRWKGRGEDREWDRGKVVDAEGVRVDVEWGRLK